MRTFKNSDVHQSVSLRLYTRNTWNAFHLHEHIVLRSVFSFRPNAINIGWHRYNNLKIIALPTNHSLNFSPLDLFQPWEPFLQNFLQFRQRLFIVWFTPLASPLSGHRVKWNILRDFSKFWICNFFSGERRGLSFFVGKLESVSLRLVLERLVLLSLDVVDRVISWLKNFCGSHFSSLLGHVRVSRLVYTLVLLLWSLDESLLNCSINRCARSFTEGLSKSIFRLDLWDIALVSRDIESIVFLTLSLWVFSVVKLRLVSSVTWNFFCVVAIVHLN